MRTRTLFALCALVLAVILFQPSAGIASATIGHLSRWLIDLGVSPRLATESRVQAVLNTAMFVPPAALATLAWPRLRWTDIVVGAFVGSVCVELLQGIFLEARTTQAIDVVTNTTGALLGALLGAAVRRRIARRRGIDERS